MPGARWTLTAPLRSTRKLKVRSCLTSRRGVGVTITDKALRIARDKAGSMVIAHLRDAVAECLSGGIAAAKVRSLVGEAIRDRLLPYSKQATPFSEFKTA